MTFPQPLELQVFEFRGWMGSGQTRPLRCRASLPDGTEVPIVLKVRNPGATGAHHGGTSLACELVMAVAARALGLQVPDFGIANVGPIFSGGVTDSIAHRVLSRNLGPNFASVQIGPAIGMWDPMCKLLSSALRRAMEGVLSFDAAVMNGDRTFRNPNLLWNGTEDVFMIDHGLACAAHSWNAAERAASPLFPPQRIQDHAGYPYLRKNAVPFSWVYDAWPTVLDASFWSSLRAIVPLEWEQSPGDIDRVIDFLSARPARFVDMGSELRSVVQ